jgi:hypothetical protein
VQQGEQLLGRHAQQLQEGRAAERFRHTHVKDDGGFVGGGDEGEVEEDGLSLGTAVRLSCW